MVYLGDSFASVRIQALRALLTCLKAVDKVPMSDANIFPVYILPHIQPLCHDKNDMVRAALAEQLAQVRIQISSMYLGLA